MMQIPEGLILRVFSFPFGSQAVRYRDGGGKC